MKADKKENELIEFEYYDRIHKRTVIVKTSRKVKEALDEMDKAEQKQRNTILRNEISADIFDLDIPVDLDYFEKDNESELINKVVDNILTNSNKLESFKKTFAKHIHKFTNLQLNVLFLYYFIGLSEKEIANHFNVTRQRIHSLLGRIIKKIKELDS